MVESIKFLIVESLKARVFAPVGEFFYAASTNLLTHAEPPLSLILSISGAGSLRVMVGLLPSPDILLRP